MRYCKEDILILTVAKYIVSGFFFSVSGKSFWLNVDYAGDDDGDDDPFQFTTLMSR